MRKREKQKLNTSLKLVAVILVTIIVSVGVTGYVASQDEGAYSFKIYQDYNFADTGLYLAKSSDGVVHFNSTDEAFVLNSVLEVVPVDGVIVVMGSSVFSSTVNINTFANLVFYGNIAGPANPLIHIGSSVFTQRGSLVVHGVMIGDSDLSYGAGASSTGIILDQANYWDIQIDEMRGFLHAVNFMATNNNCAVNILQLNHLVNNVNGIYMSESVGNNYAQGNDITILFSNNNDCTVRIQGTQNNVNSFNIASDYNRYDLIDDSGGNTITFSRYYLNLVGGSKIGTDTIFHQGSKLTFNTNPKPVNIGVNSQYGSETTLGTGTGYPMSALNGIIFDINGNFIQGEFVGIAINFGWINGTTNQWSKGFSSAQSYTLSPTDLASVWLQDNQLSYLQVYAYTNEPATSITITVQAYGLQ